MKWRLGILSILLSVMLIVNAAGTATAHILKIDNLMGAVLHIKPDDNPTINTPFEYVVRFRETTGAFDLAQCNCSATFLLDGKTIDKKPLRPTSATVSENTQILTTSGTYTVQIDGRATKGDEFKPFTLQYSVRVGDIGRKSGDIPALLLLGMLLSIGLILLAAFSINEPSVIKEKEKV